MSLNFISEIISKNIKDSVSAEINNEAYLNYFHDYDNLPSIKDTEEQLIQEALIRSKGNQSIAAKMLGISRQTLNKKLKNILLKINRLSLKNTKLFISIIFFFQKNLLKSASIHSLKLLKLLQFWM